MISDILSFAAVFKSAYFSWIPRERNILADTLAKEVLFVGEPLVVDGGTYVSEKKRTLHKLISMNYNIVWFLLFRNKTYFSH